MVIPLFTEYNKEMAQNSTYKILLETTSRIAMKLFVAKRMNSTQHFTGKDQLSPSQLSGNLVLGF